MGCGVGVDTFMEDGSNTGGEENIRMVLVVVVVCVVCVCVFACMCVYVCVAVVKLNYTNHLYNYS